MCVTEASRAKERRDIAALELLSDAIHRLHHEQGLMQRHDGAFRALLSKTAVDLCDLIMETLPDQEGVDALGSNAVDPRGRPFEASRPRPAPD